MKFEFEAGKFQDGLGNIPGVDDLYVGHRGGLHQWKVHTALPGCHIKLLAQWVSSPWVNQPYTDAPIPGKVYRIDRVSWKGLQSAEPGELDIYIDGELECFDLKPDVDYVVVEGPTELRAYCNHDALPGTKEQAARRGLHPFWVTQGRTSDREWRHLPSGYEDGKFWEPMRPGLLVDLTDEERRALRV